MAEDRRRPVRTLRRALSGIVGSSSEPPADVVERDDCFEVWIDLPGYAVQDIDVRARNSRLQVVAEDGTESRNRRVRGERPSGRVSRVIELPEPIDEEHVTATYRNGLLWIRAKKWATRRRPPGPRDVR